MLERGGYVPQVDHLVPSYASLENFAYYRNKLNDMVLGKAK